MTPSSTHSYSDSTPRRHADAAARSASASRTSTRTAAWSDFARKGVPSAGSPSHLRSPTAWSTTPQPAEPSSLRTHYRVTATDGRSPPAATTTSGNDSANDSPGYQHKASPPTGYATPHSPGSNATTALPGVARGRVECGQVRRRPTGRHVPGRHRVRHPQEQRLTVVTEAESISAEAQDLIATVRDLPGPAGTEPTVGGAAVVRLWARRPPARAERTIHCGRMAPGWPRSGRPRPTIPARARTGCRGQRAG